MPNFTYNGKEYETDSYGYLTNPYNWDENFAEGMAKELCNTDKLSERHWQVIYFLREALKEFKSCPLVFVTCKKK